MQIERISRLLVKSRAFSPYLGIASLVHRIEDSSSLWACPWYDFLCKRRLSSIIEAAESLFKICHPRVGRKMWPLILGGIVALLKVTMTLWKLMLADVSNMTLRVQSNMWTHLGLSVSQQVNRTILGPRRCLSLCLSQFRSFSKVS